MEHRPLGRTGVSVSKFCLGAMMFGAWGNPDHDDSIRIIHAALDAGVNFIDTADVYSGGVSEEIVGQALGSRRDDVFLATKFFMPMGEDDPNRRGGSRRWIMRAVEDSLRRLNTDYIDLYQVHRPSPDTDVEETLGALTDLVRDDDGWARARLSGPAGSLELAVDRSWPWLQVFSGDQLPEGRRRQSLAIEPMTCPPNAFADHADLLVLEPGDAWAGTWTLSWTTA